MGNIGLLLHPKILLLLAASMLVWLTQPPVSASETKDQQATDKHTVLLILSMSALSIILPIADWAYLTVNKDTWSVTQYIGLLMMLVGIIFRAWAVRYLGKYFTPTVQIQTNHQLITSGPYQIVRHPSYTGAYLVIVSAALVLNSWVGFVLANTCMITAYYFRIKQEEAVLTAYFGKAYHIYASKTKRIIPFVW
jgi:protein-S-isoprenylcysteine O-methyltransferase Ste14